MTPLFKKLNFKDQKAIVAINSPASFATELQAMQEFSKIITDLVEVDTVDFAICFLNTLKEIEWVATDLFPKLNGDALLWICYPKGTSKQYSCEFNRDTGWASLGAVDLEPVRMVAIDQDWSALRFRKVGYIKTITRRESFALTEEAKARTTQKDLWAEVDN